MVAYGDTTTIAQMLEPDTPSGFSASLTARIDAQREVVSRLIDEKTGRSFGSAGTSETRTIRPGGSSDVLILPAPVRSISAITVDRIAAMPVAVAMQASAPSRAASRSCMVLTVGFEKRA